MRALTLAEAAEALDPPMPRRELARRLKDVPSLGAVYGRRGRRAATYPARAIMQAHAEWVREELRRNAGKGDRGRSGEDRHEPVVVDDAVLGSVRSVRDHSDRGPGQGVTSRCLANDLESCQNSALEESA